MHHNPTTPTVKSSIIPGYLEITPQAMAKLSTTPMEMKDIIM